MKCLILSLKKALDWSMMTTATTKMTAKEIISKLITTNSSYDEEMALVVEWTKL